MLSTQARLLPVGDEVAAKVIDGEAIIINLVNGSYYSMVDAGAEVWSLIERGCSLDEIVESVAASYEVDEETARADVASLSSDLLEEGLVSLASETEAGSVHKPAATHSGERSPYEAPKLVKYTDMADLLALDPPMPGLAENPWAENGDG